MKATFAKVLGLALVLALMLSGCNLIEIDAKMQADEDIAKIDKLYSQPVATYYGGEITVSEAVGDFNALYNETAYMYYYYFGSEVSHDEVHTMAEDVLADHVRTEIVAKQFDAEHTLTEEEIAAMESEFQTSYDSYMASALESAEGKTEEARSENARVILREFGADYDSLYANFLNNAKVTRMEEILREEITEVSDEELQSAFDAKVAEQKSYYIDGSSFESDMCDESIIVCWQPADYRTVKHILVMPEEAVKTAYTDAVSALESARMDLEALESELYAANDDDIAEGERSAEEIQQEISSLQGSISAQEAAVETAAQDCLANVREKTDEIYARLEAGENFDALIAEFGEDPGMQNEPTMSRGYCVSDVSVNWETNFRDAAMQLMNIGDYTTTPVVSDSGVHIIQYTADVAPGEVPMELVHDALYAETLENLKNTHSEDTINAWVEDARPSYDVSAFESALSIEH